MRSASVLARVAAGVVLALALGDGKAASCEARSSAAVEVARVREHLAGAERLLRSRDLTALTSAQRRARAGRIAELRAYRARGVFPHNHHLLDARIPVFVDEHGTRCAMAWLIERSGGGGLVRRIAATRNFARVRDLADEPGLSAWLERNGITLAEAARIQPSYGGDGGGNIHSSPAAAPEKVLGIAGLALAGYGASMGLHVAPTQGARNRRGIGGFAFGLVGGAMGIAVVKHSTPWVVLGCADVAIGLTSMVLSVRQLNAEPATQSSESGLRVGPMTWREADGTRRVAIVASF